MAVGGRGAADGVCLAGQDVLHALNNQSGFVETFGRTPADHEGVKQIPLFEE